MADNVIINVNSELNNMKKHIADIDSCTSKVNEIGESAKLYAVNYKINIMTIVTTIYALACAIAGYNSVLLVIGVVMIALLVWLKGKDFNKTFGICVIVNGVIVASSILFFMWLYNYIPIIFVLIQWIITVFSNFKLKNKVWQISSSL